MKKVLLLFALLIGTIVAYAAEDVTITPTAVSGTVDGYSFKADKSDGGTEPAYNASGKDVRVYAKGTLTISTIDKSEFTKIVFNISTQGKKRLAPITASVGEIAPQVNGDATVTWTGQASEVTFTVGEKADYGSESTKAGQFCFTDFVITPADVKDDGRTKVTLTFAEPEGQVAINATDFVLPLTVDPAEAISDVVFTSSNENVATIESSGKVNILGEGSTTITAKIEDSANYRNATAIYNLTVFDPLNTVLKFSEVAGIQAGNLSDITVGAVTFTFGKGNNANNVPIYNATDKGARIYGGNTITISVDEGFYLKSVSFCNSNGNDVSFISGASVTHGTLTGGTWAPANRFVSPFTLTNGGTSNNTKVDNIKVSLVAADDLELEEYINADFKDYEIQTNEEITFNLPDYAPSVTFVSTDEEVVVVENNVLKPVAAGEATITASWEEGNGWKAGTKEFKVTVTQALLDPVFEIVGETAIVVSEEDDLEIHFIYEGVQNPEFTITSSKPEYATATVDAATKTITVDILKRGTTEFTLSVAGDETYDKASIKFLVKVCYKDLATILENAVEGETYTGVFPVTLMYEHDSYNYVTDGTAWALFYVDKNEAANHIHGAGAVIPAGWTAKYTVYNDLPEFTEIEHEAEVVEHEDVVFNVYSDVTITEEMLNQVVVLKNVTFDDATESDYKNNFIGTFNGNDYTFRNQFGIASYPAGTYDVKVAVNVYKGVIQLYPIEFTEARGVYTAEGTVEIVPEQHPEADYKVNNLCLTVNVYNEDQGRVDNKNGDYMVLMNGELVGFVGDKMTYLPYDANAVFTVQYEDRQIPVEIKGWESIAGATTTIDNLRYRIGVDPDDDTKGHLWVNFELGAAHSIDGEVVTGFKFSGDDYVLETEHMDGHAMIYWENGKVMCQLSDVKVVDMDGSNIKDEADLAFEKISITPLFSFLVEPAAQQNGRMRAPSASNYAICEVEGVATPINHESAKEYTNEGVSGVADVVVDGEAVVEFYNLQGVKVEGELAPGLYIRRQGNEATKVIVK